MKLGKYINILIDKLKKLVVLKKIKFEKNCKKSFYKFVFVCILVYYIGGVG